MPDKTQRLRYTAGGSALVLLSSFFYGSYGVWTRLLGPGVGAFSQAAQRSLFVVIIILPILIAAKQLAWPSLRRDWKWLLLMAISSAFSQSANFVAINKLGIGLAVTTMFTVYVLLLMVWGSLYDKVPFTRKTLSSLALAVLGLCLLFNPLGGTVNVAGLALAIIGGFAITGTVVGAKYLGGKPLYAVFINWGFGAIVNTAIALIIREDVGPLFTTSKLGIVLLFTVASLLASFTVSTGVRKISAALTGLIGLLENVFALIFGVIFFSEAVNAAELSGVVLILLAIGLPDLVMLLAKNQPALEKIPPA